MIVSPSLEVVNKIVEMKKSNNVLVFTFLINHYILFDDVTFEELAFGVPCRKGKTK